MLSCLLLKTLAEMYNTKNRLHSICARHTAIISLLLLPLLPVTATAAYTTTSLLPGSGRTGADSEGACQGGAGQLLRRLVQTRRLRCLALMQHQPAGPDEGAADLIAVPLQQMHLHMRPGHPDNAAQHRCAGDQQFGKSLLSPQQSWHTLTRLVVRCEVPPAQLRPASPAVHVGEGVAAAGQVLVPGFGLLVHSVARRPEQDSRRALRHGTAASARPAPATLRAMYTASCRRTCPIQPSHTTAL